MLLLFNENNHYYII